MVVCGVDNNKLENKLKVVLDVEEKQLQEEIRLLEQDVNKIAQDRLRIENERNAEIQKRKDEATKKREEERRISREKEEKRKGQHIVFRICIVDNLLPQSRISRCCKSTSSPRTFTFPRFRPLGIAKPVKMQYHMKESATDIDQPTHGIHSFKPK